MPSSIGAHSPRIAAVRELATAKGRRQQQRFAFEGPTLLAEAQRCAVPIRELYATQAAYDTWPFARELEARGTELFLVDERTAAKLSDVETPTGLVAVAPLALSAIDAILAEPGIVLVLAGLNDPGNAGTLLRSADAFGARGVVFGRLGVDPYHPKVVRAAMGSLFRLPLAVASPVDLAAAIGGRPVMGLAGDGEPLKAAQIPADAILIVGHERTGLGAWEPLCTKRIAIPTHGRAESLNAAVAGSIALYEAFRGGS